MDELEQFLKFHMTFAGAAVVLVQLNLLFGMVLEFRKARYHYPRKIAIRRRAYLGLWGAASPILDWIHVYRLLKPGTSLLRRDTRSLTPVFVEPLHKPKTPVKAHFVFVHGSWATENFKVRWQPMIEAIKVQHPHARIWGVHWLAFNSAAARYVMAVAALRRLRTLLRVKSSQPVILIGFSHGGTLINQLMHHPACPKHWQAVTVGMPLLVSETTRAIKTERLYGQDLLWHPIHSKIGGLALGYGWPVFPVFFGLAYFTGDQFGLMFKVLSWILLALWLYAKYFDAQLEQQGKHNDAKLSRIKERHARILRRRILGNDSDYLAYCLVGLHRVPINRGKLRTVHLVESKDEVWLFSDAGFDTSSARLALNCMPARKAELSGSISRALEISSSGFFSRWLWPGPAIWAFREIEWFGTWNLHRQVRKEAGQRGRAGIFIAPRGLMMVTAGIVTFGACSVASIGLAAISATTWAPWFNAAIVMFVGFHPAIRNIQVLLGRLSGVKWSEEELTMKILERMRLLSPAYDSMAVNDRMQLRNLSAVSETVCAQTTVAETISLGRHRASVSDPWVVAKVLEIVYQVKSGRRSRSK